MTAPHVLHVVQPVTEGAARCVAGWAAGVRDHGFAVTVASPAGGTLGAELAAAGVPWVPWAATREPGRGVPGEVRRLARVVAGVRPDLVHLHSSKAGLAGRLAVRGRVPTVLTPHAWSWHAAGPLLRPAVLRGERHLARWTDLLLAVSAAEAQEAARAGVRPRAVASVPQGVVVGAPVDRVAARDRLGLDARPLLLAVGRLVPQKGHDVLLAALAQLGELDVQVVLVGEGPLRGQLGGDPRVRLVGARQGVAEWLAAADVVVQPSRWEGQALVPLEAMAAGRSVVATRVGGAAEAVPAGAGAVVPPEDPAALAAALRPRLDGSRDPDAEGAVGRAHVLAHHTLGATVEAVAAAYDEVLARSRP